MHVVIHVKTTSTTFTFTQNPVRMLVRKFIAMPRREKRGCPFFLCGSMSGLSRSTTSSLSLRSPGYCCHGMLISIHSDDAANEPPAPLAPCPTPKLKSYSFLSGCPFLNHCIPLYLKAPDRRLMPLLLSYSRAATSIRSYKIPEVLRAL